ncbi:ABC-2 family transporter protein [Tissierella sp.]|uniref:ABC transporter permease n=1 Tax=Tissierella sp. TaxID=41274 RepID=UPI003020A00C
MKRFIYYADLFFAFIKLYFKRIMIYKLDFLLGVIPLILTQIIELFFINIVFLNTQTIKGWTLHQVLLLYSFFIIASGLENMFFYSLTQLKTYIFQGALDIVLIRPINEIFYIIIQEFNYYAIGQVFFGMFMLVYAIQNLNIVITIKTIILICYFIFIATIILAALTLASVSFFLITEGTFSPTNIITSLQQFLKYPITIFNRYIQAILTFIIPLAFVSFIPSTYLLDKNMSLLSICSIELLVALIMTCIGTCIFYAGLKKYQGVGN